MLSLWSYPLISCVQVSVNILRFYCRRIAAYFPIGSPSPIPAFDQCLDDIEPSDDVFSSSRRYSEDGVWTSSEDEGSDTEQDEDEARLIFEEHRKAHYNEFRTVKELIRSGSLTDIGAIQDNNDQTNTEETHNLPGAIDIHEGKK
ncbi:protein phosphatase inhibitor 2 [Canna indica]|uniref:Protein phosphatase inhibitor 2 n=1 Tax=Canna indica TaxID=4628 RepID=A0AAQ3Q8D7_9LILI|nr:protein phosphatase inhibitor 2 [Canna indica]